jgi:ABC-type antimicrobial peptide transport system permease subunit
MATALGLLALLLSGMGVYGVMAFMVTERTREMGIRAALGAEPGLVLRSVVRGAFRLALPGLVTGAVLAVGVGVLLRSILLGVSPLDPLALAGVAGAMVGMVLLGTLIPARRAASVDPAEALRYD